MDRADNRRFGRALMCCAAMLLAAIPGPSATGAGKFVSGYVETVKIHPGELTLDAKIDTGAEHSSVNATDVDAFLRDGKPWVRFTLTDGAQGSTVIEGPVLRIARIRRHGGGVQERQVILIGICLGTVFKTVEVNLVDRSGFDYQLLLGRSFLGADFLVDPDARHLLQPQCR